MIFIVLTVSKYFGDVQQSCYTVTTVKNKGFCLESSTVENESGRHSSHMTYRYEKLDSNQSAATWQTLQLVEKKCMAKGCFDVPKKAILERDYRFFAAVLSEMDLGNVDTREVQVFVGTTLECVVRKTDWHFSIRKVYWSRYLEILATNHQEINQYSLLTC